MKLKTKKMRVGKALLAKMDNYYLSRSMQARCVARKLDKKRYDLKTIPKSLLDDPETIDIELPVELYNTKTNQIRDCIAWEFEQMNRTKKIDSEVYEELDHIEDCIVYVGEYEKYLKSPTERSK